MTDLLAGLVVALIGAGLAIFGLKNKNALSNLINNNAKVIDEVKSIDSQIVTNNVTLSEEELKRGTLKADNSAAVSQQNLLDFFNNQGKK